MLHQGLVLKYKGAKKKSKARMHEHEFQSSVSSSRISCCNSGFVIPSTPAIAELISRESKKLEKQMRTQFRRRARIERSNQMLLTKQEINREKRTRWENKLVTVEAQKFKRGRVLKQINNARANVHDTLTSKVSLSVVRRMEAVMARQIESELRVERNLRLQEASTHQQADAWESKYEEVRERLSQKDQEEAQKAEHLLTKLRESSVLFQARKDRYISLQRVKGEEVNLRLMDALEKKEKINLEQSHKLGEISALIRQEDEQGLVEQFTKAEIIKRRKAISELSRLTTPFTAPIDTSPGPCDYVATYTSPLQANSFAKSDQIHTSLFQIPTAYTPAPGEYNPRVLADGTKPWNEDPVLSFGSSVKTSYLDEQQKQKRLLPGPATYDISPRPLPNTAPKIVPNLVMGRTEIDTPGPGTYTLDRFMKTEKIIRAVSTADNMFKNLFTVPSRPAIIPDYDLEI